MDSEPVGARQSYFYQIDEHRRSVSRKNDEGEGFVAFAEVKYSPAPQDIRYVIYHEFYPGSACLVLRASADYLAGYLEGAVNGTHELKLINGLPHHIQRRLKHYPTMPPMAKVKPLSRESLGMLLSSTLIRSFWAQYYPLFKE